MKQVSELSSATKMDLSASDNTTATAAKILIVDSNPLSRMTAIDLLSLDGYKVIEADDAASIFALVADRQPDLILLDAMMRQVDSFALCRQLKENRDTANIPIVLTTLNDNRQIRIEAMQANADDVLVKPLDRMELSTRVKSLVNQKRLNDGFNGVEQILFTIAKAVDNRSLGKDASVRVTSLVKSFSEYLGLSRQESDNLIFASRIHDIGTVAIPDAVMLKEGELTTEERELIRQHVLFGEQICQPLLNRSGVLPIIRHHHEKWDGTGYPDGLSGDEIPYLAQIFQVIDIYDALTSDRPHKKAYSPAEALRILKEETQQGWRNPKLVEQFTAFIGDKEL